MASEQSIQMLTVKGDVLAFQCKRLTSKTRDHQRGCEVSFCIMCFKRDSQSFSINDHSMQPVHKDSSADIHVIHCSSAVDVQQRQKVPCVLLRLCKKRTSGFKYMLYSISSTKNAKLHVEFVLPYEMRDNIAILRGPTLVWCHENAVFYASSQAGGVKEVPVPMTVNFIGELPLHRRKLVIQGTQKVSKKKGQREQVNVTGEKNILYCIEDGRTFNGGGLIPDAYSSVVRCMIVLSAEEVDGSLRSAVLAATSMKQLVYFENGLPGDVCPLPYEHPLNIQLVYTLKNDCIVAITFDQGNVCTVWKDTFQVASCWTGVRLLLIDDFLGCGTDQMLLVFEEQSCSGELLSNFLLTDLCGITLSCSKADSEDPFTSDTVQENYHLTVQALESRLQSGLNFLEDLQKDVDVKDRVLQQSLVALTDLVSGREHVISSPEQEGLVSLWDEDGEGEAEDDVLIDRMQTESGEPPLKVERVWQRVIEESLIFGAVLTTTTNTSVRNISGSFLAEPCQTGAAPVAVKSKSITLQYFTSDMSAHPCPSTVKKIRHSDCSADSVLSKLALLTVTDLAPLLSSGCVKCPVMLHYSTKEPSGSFLEEFSRVSYHCGQVSMDIKDVSRGKFHPRLLQDCKLNTEEAREDLLSLIAVLRSWFLLMECSDHTLMDVQGWLQESLHAERLEVDPRYMLAATAGSSGYMLFHWQQSTPFHGMLTVQCRNELCFLQFLQSLCDFLPVSHHVQLLKTPRSRRDSQGLARALEREIQTITETVSSLPPFGEREADGRYEMKREGISDPTSEQLEKLRMEWQKEKERYNKRLHPLVDATRYSRLVKGLIHTQLEGDEVALMEAQHLVYS